MKPVEKTNVMRLLEAAGIPYAYHLYPCPGGAISGVEIAASLGEDPERVFKTLATQGASKAIYVFLIPVGAELDLKKAAKAAGEKSVSMLHLKDLLPTVGYVHGATSPIGLKKPFPVYVDETAQLFDAIIFSGGKIGYQVEMKLEDLQRIVPFALADLAA